MGQPPEEQGKKRWVDFPHWGDSLQAVVFFLRQPPDTASQQIGKSGPRAFRPLLQQLPLLNAHPKRDDELFRMERPSLLPLADHAQPPIPDMAKGV